MSCILHFAYFHPSDSAVAKRIKIEINRMSIVTLNFNGSLLLTIYLIVRWYLRLELTPGTGHDQSPQRTSNRQISKCFRLSTPPPHPQDRTAN